MRTAHILPLEAWRRQLVANLLAWMAAHHLIE